MPENVLMKSINVLNLQSEVISQQIFLDFKHKITLVLIHFRYLSFIIFFMMQLCKSGFAQHTTLYFPLNEKVSAICNSNKGYLYIGTTAGNLYQFDGITYAILLDELPPVNCIKPYRGQEKETLLIGTREGLYLYNEDKVEAILNLKIDVQDWQECDGTIQLVGKDGLFELHKYEITPPYNSPEASFSENAKIKKQDGNCFFSSVNAIQRSVRPYKTKYQNEIPILSFTHFDEQLFLGDTNGLYIIENGLKRNYLLEGKYIDHPVDFLYTSGDKLIICSSEKTYLWDIHHYHLTDISFEINKRQNKVLSATTGNWDNIWLGTTKGLVMISEKADKGSNNPPLLHLEKIIYKGETLPPDQNTITIREASPDIAFRFSAYHLSAPQKVQFQWKLDGLQKNWSPLTDERSVEFMDLPPGRYQFELRATIDKKYFTYTEPVKINVSEKVLNKWILLLFGIGFSILVIALLASYRFSVFKKNLEREKEKLRAENRLLTIQQKALQLQMNPHFVFNALNSIQGLIAIDDKKNARKYLREFSSMMRSVLEHSRKDKISLEDEISYLDKYLSLESMTRGDAFNFVIETEDNLDQEILIPPMIIQPFVENAIIHGVLPLKDKGKIRLYFETLDKGIKCTISDNGVGRKVSTRIRKAGHTSHGVNVVRERLQSLWKSKNINCIMYEDGFSDSETSGTTAIVLLPILG